MLLKPQSMRKIKFLVTVLAVLFVCTLLYANLRRRSPSEDIKPIHLAAFNIGLPDKNQSTEVVRNRISGTTGVTSCALSTEKNLIAITYHPDEISEKELGKIINSSSDEMSVSVKDLAANASAGCPVQKLNSSLNSWVKALDFRNQIN